MDVVTTTTIYLKIAMSPLIILLAVFLIISSFRIRRIYKIDLIICITVFIAGAFLLVYGVSDFILTPYINLSFI